MVLRNLRAREKELYRPCVPIDDGDDHDRLQADVEAVNVFLSTCGEPTGTPVFIVERKKGFGACPTDPWECAGPGDRFPGRRRRRGRASGEPWNGWKKKKKGPHLPCPGRSEKTQEAWENGRRKPVPARREW